VRRYKHIVRGVNVKKWAIEEWIDSNPKVAFAIFFVAMVLFAASESIWLGAVLVVAMAVWVGRDVWRFFKNPPGSR
jgi:hypothetical protein